MKFGSDSSFVLRLYLKGKETDLVQEFLEADAKVIAISDLARIEILNVLLRHEHRAEQFAADLAEGLRLRLESADWPAVFRQAESLARRFSAKLRPGGHDLVIVAAAVASAATWFLSFDRHSRQRPLAAVAGLKVWPPLDKDEKGLVRFARAV